MNHKILLLPASRQGAAPRPRRQRFSRTNTSLRPLPMLRLRHALGLVTLMFCVPVSAGAQSGRAGTHGATSYFRREITTDQGLPETQVNALAQTPDGYLWLGTRRGLVRYDGVSFHLYSSEETPALATGVINGLTVDRAGRLWLATAKGLVVREGDSFRRINATQVPEAMTWKVLEDRRGQLWVAGAFGLRVGDGASFRPLKGVDAYLYGLAEDAAGRMWMAGREYLASIGERDSLPTIARLARGERFFDVATDGGRGLWVATRHGAWHLDLTDHRNVQVKERVAPGSPELGNEVWALARTADGDVWLGTERQGVLRWDGDHLTSYEPTTDVPDQVWTLLVDARGRVWAGTAAGLLRFQRSAFTTLKDGLQPQSVWSVREDTRGTRWAATSDGSVYRLDGTRWLRVVGRAGRNLSSTTWPLAEGGLLVARAGGSVLKVGTAKPEELTSRFALTGREVRGVFEDADRALWITTDSGVYRWRGGAAVRMSGALGLGPTDSPRVIQRDTQQRLLLGGPWLTIVENGSSRRLGANVGLTDHDVLALHSEGGNTWIGTADSGLYVLRHERIVHLGRFDPRLRREILGIAEDDLGYLWLTSSFGLYRVSRRELEAAADGNVERVTLRSFDRSDGLPTTEFNGDYQSQLLKDRQGALWLPSYAGVVRVNPGAVSADTLPPQVHLERLIVEGRDLPVSGPVSLASHASRVELTFAATNALVPARVRVEYRMHGVDTVWQAAGLRRTVSYGPLRGGNYRFEVRAAGEDGHWNPVLAALELRVALALHERNWFTPGIILLSVGVVLAGARLRQRSLEQRGQRLAALVEDRTRDLEASRAQLEKRVEERTAELADELEERKRLEQQLVQAQKLEGIGRLAGGVAHEINNSITSVLGFAELAERNAAGQSLIVNDLKEVRSAGQRVAEITGQLLAFARRQQTRATAVRLEEVLRTFGRQMQHVVGAHIHVTTHLPAVLPTVRADKSQVEQLLLNLVMNARDAMPEGGTIAIDARVEQLGVERTIGDATLPAASYVAMTVADSGVGMDAAIRARLFEPFFTTKPVNRGTGLGLAVCHGIVAQHGGAIDVDSAPGQGTRVRVWLPVWQGSETAPAVVGAEPIGTETVLLVEDEPGVRAVAGRALSLFGYHVLEAADGAAALTMVGDTLGSIDIVVSDVMMPHLTGPDLVRAMRERRPDLPVVFMSGYAGPESPGVEDLARFGPMIAKPFTHDRLARVVRDELDRWNARRRRPGRYVR